MVIVPHIMAIIIMGAKLYKMIIIIMVVILHMITIELAIELAI
jgi:hypothetical protein